MEIIICILCIKIILNRFCDILSFYFLEDWTLENIPRGPTLLKHYLNTYFIMKTALEKLWNWHHRLFKHPNMKTGTGKFNLENVISVLECSEILKKCSNPPLNNKKWSTLFFYFRKFMYDWINRWQP